MRRTLAFFLQLSRFFFFSAFFFTSTFDRDAGVIPSSIDAFMSRLSAFSKTVIQGFGR